MFFMVSQSEHIANFMVSLKHKKLGVFLLRVCFCFQCYLPTRMYSQQHLFVLSSDLIIYAERGWMSVFSNIQPSMCVLKLSSLCVSQREQ